MVLAVVLTRNLDLHRITVFTQAEAEVEGDGFCTFCFALAIMVELLVLFRGRSEGKAKGWTGGTNTVDEASEESGGTGT